MSFAADDGLHFDPGLEFGAVGASLARCWMPLSGRCPASEVNNGTCKEKPDGINGAGIYLLSLLDIATAGPQSILEPSSEAGELSTGII